MDLILHTVAHAYIQIDLCLIFVFFLIVPDLSLILNGCSLNHTVYMDSDLCAVFIKDKLHTKANLLEVIVKILLKHIHTVVFPHIPSYASM